MLYIKVVTRTNPKVLNATGKKQHNTPEIEILPPRDRFTDSGERSVVGKGLKGSRPSPEAELRPRLTGLWPSLQEQVDGSSLWKHQGGAKLRTSGVSAGLTLACSPSSQALAVLPWNDGSLALSQASQGRA